MTKRIEFNTNQFKFSHGKEPRGIGRWAFKAFGLQTEFYGSITEAKRKAASFYAKHNPQGFIEISILS